MNINIEISDELEARIITQSLYESIEMMYDDLCYLSSESEPLLKYQKEDLADGLVMIEALKETYKYYTITEKWSKLDRFDLVKTEEAMVDYLGIDFPEEACDEPDESLKSNSLVNQSDLQWM